MPLDLPPQLQERVVCSIAAAAKYEIPANLVLAVAEQEGGKPGQWVRNANGTHDVGAMQFNTAYLAGELARYGITPADAAAPGCYPYELASWRLRMHIRNDSGDLWTKAANYHSRTPYYNGIYRAQIMQRAAKWGSWLEARFATFDLTRGTTVSPSTAATLLPMLPAMSKPAAPLQRVPATAYASRATAYTTRAITASAD
jgi:hypothetical protein